MLPCLQCFPTVQQLHIVKSSNKQWAAIRVIQYFCFCLTQSRSAAACTRLLGYLLWPGDSEGRARGSGRWAAPWSPTLATGHNNNHYLSGASGKSCSGPAYNTLFSAGNHSVCCWSSRPFLCSSSDGVAAAGGVTESHVIFARWRCWLRLWPGGSTLKCIWNIQWCLVCSSVGSSAVRTAALALAPVCRHCSSDAAAVCTLVPSVVCTAVHPRHCTVAYPNTTLGGWLGLFTHPGRTCPRSPQAEYWPTFIGNWLPANTVTVRGQRSSTGQTAAAAAASITSQWDWWWRCVVFNRLLLNCCHWSLISQFLLFSCIHVTWPSSLFQMERSWVLSNQNGEEWFYSVAGWNRFPRHTAHHWRHTAAARRSIWK